MRNTWVQAPKWLHPLAKELWDTLKPELMPVLDASNKHTFAVLCETYALWRVAVGTIDKSKHLNDYLKLCKEFGLTPKSSKKKPKTEENKLQSFLNGHIEKRIA